MGEDEHGMAEDYGEEEYMVDGEEEFHHEEEPEEQIDNRVDKQEITDRFIHSTLLRAINQARTENNLPAFFQNLILEDIAKDFAQVHIVGMTQESAAKKLYLIDDDVIGPDYKER